MHAIALDPESGALSVFCYYCVNNYLVIVFHVYFQCLILILILSGMLASAFSVGNMFF